MPHRPGRPGLWGMPRDFMLAANILLFDTCGVGGCFTLPYLKAGNSLFVAELLTLAETCLALAIHEPGSS